MNVQIIKADHHRNGISGEPFYAVVFIDLTDQHTRMFAVLFSAPWHCAVFSIDELEKENIEFAQGNSWRGDRYDTTLRSAMVKYFGHELFV